MSLRLKVGGRNLRQQRLHPPQNLPQLKVMSLVCYTVIVSVVHDNNSTRQLGILSISIFLNMNPV